MPNQIGVFFNKILGLAMICLFCLTKGKEFHSMGAEKRNTLKPTSSI